jgi:lysozyme family protein
MAQYRVATLRPEYDRLWKAMRITNPAPVNAVARRIIALKSQYMRVQNDTGVPWFVVGVMHYRESNLNFATWLHNGDPMRNKFGQGIKTTRVPPNRPPNPNVDWFAGAYDALVTVKGFNTIRVWDAAQIAYVNESYNGFGYRNPSINIPSPYLWGATNIQKRGKYIRDRVYDAGTWDNQLGVMAILRAILDMEKIALPGDGGKPIPVPAPAPAPTPPPIPQTPKAEDPPGATVRPPARSRSIWGAIVSGASGIGGAVSAAFAYLNNPYALGAFAMLCVLIVVGVYLQIRGYIDVRKVVLHLQDEGEDLDGDGQPG